MTDQALQIEQTPLLTKRETSLWRNKNFLFLWIASICSSVSISMFAFSQSWYVVEVLGLEASMGLIFIASSVPRLLFMAIGGVLADRMSKTKVMIISDVSRAILLGGIVALLILDVVNLWTFVCFALVFGVLDAFFWPASSSLMPTLVKPEQLTRANSMLQTTNQMLFIIGPMFAGFIIFGGGYSITFGFTGALLLFAAILLAFIRVHKEAPQEAVTSTAENNTDLPDGQQAQSTEKKEGILAEILQGIKYVRASVFLTTLLLASLFLNLLVAGPLTMGLPLYVKNVLDGDTLTFSFLEGGLAAGMLLGAVLVGILNIQKRRGRFSFIMLMFAAVFMLLLSQSSIFWLSLPVVALMGLALSASNIPLITAVQSIVEKAMLGRIMSLLTMTSMGLIPVSFAITSILLAVGIPIQTIMTGGAVLFLAFVIIVYIKVDVLRTLD